MAEVQAEIEAPLLRNSSDDVKLEKETSFADDAEREKGVNFADNDDDRDESLEFHEKEEPDEIGVESLDYDPIHSMVFSKLKKIQQPRRLYGYTGLTLAKWTITFTVGVLVGIVAYVIELSQDLLVNLKKDWTQDAIDFDDGLYVAFGRYLAFGMFLVVVSSCLVLYLAPAAAGGGVTLVMAYLNGNDIPDFFRPRTLFTKIFGTICTISSGLPIGQEGPMVHIGAAIASSLTWMQGHFPSRTKDGRIESKSFFSKLKPKAFVFDFHNDKDRREFISAGTAAGLAAAFGAPVGGVLFSLEEASSFWSKKVMWRSLLCTSVATLVLSWLHERAFSFALPGSIAFRGLQPEFVVGDLPLFIITSAVAGVFGAFVNTAHGWLARIRPSPDRNITRLGEACLVTFICIAAIFILPHFFGQCLLRQEGEEDLAYWFRYTCPQQDSELGAIYYNDLATLFFSVPHQTIQKLLQLGKETTPYFSLTSLAIHCGSFLVLFILSYGIATPGGIFMPSMMVGASLGAFLGCIFEKLFPSGDVQPGLHALIGAAAMLGGVFRTSISVVVILTEGTGGIDFVLPIILATVVSNWVAHHIHNAGAYEADLERLGDICFLPSEPPHSLIPVTASEILAKDVVCFPEVPTVREVVNVLRNTRHNGFPVLRYSMDSEGAEDGLLVGLILRHQLLVLLEERAFVEVEGAASYQRLPDRPSQCDRRLCRKYVFMEHAMRVYHHCHNPHRRYLTARASEVDNIVTDEFLQESTAQNVENESEQSEEEASTPKKELGLDLRPFMNRSPVTVREECSAQRVFLIFRTLGLRHLCVTDATNRVIGMITRKDIAKAEHTFSKAPAKLQPSLSSVTGKASNKDLYYYLP